MKSSSLEFLLLLLAAAAPLYGCYAQDIQDPCLESLANGPSRDHDPVGFLAAAGDGFELLWNNGDDALVANGTATVEYNEPATISLTPQVPDGAVALYQLQSENFRVAGSRETVAIGPNDEPFEWTFDRVGTFDLNVYIVFNYNSQQENATCQYYRNQPTSFEVAPGPGMVAVGADNQYPRCALCPVDENLSESDFLLLEDTGREQTCAQWNLDGLDGRLTLDLCQQLQAIEAVEGNGCSCVRRSGSQPSTFGSTPTSAGYAVDTNTVFLSVIASLLSFVLS